MENNENNEALKSANSGVDTQKQPIDYEKELQALTEKYNSLNKEYIKKSNAYDKVSSENADWKNKYNSTLSDVEKERIANEEREAHYKEIERKYNLNELSMGLSETISDKEVVNNIASKMLDGDNKGAIDALNKYIKANNDNLSKQIKEQLLKDNPTPPPTNTTNNGGVSKKDFEKMSYSERVELKNKNPELYEKLTK